ncbi:hypothetical protein JW960_24125 [candidate division KSB1 bacterium]|nr:hypothetical protein [candidate division KSB1 bacterium]
MKRFRIFAIAFVIIISFIVLRCNIDKGLDIIPWIEGRLIIDSIDRVDEGQTGDVVVVVAPDFPPKKWTDIIKTPPLEFDRTVRTDTISYKVPLNYGTYDVVAVLWKPKGKEWSFETISNILGVYIAPNVFRPKSVTIHPGDTFVPNVNIYSDFGYVRYGATIKGTITYEGDFNPRTDMLVLASFPMKPETVVDYLFALGWDLTLPTESKSYNPYEFELDVAPAYHKYIALFWKGKGGNPYDFRRIAAVELPDDLPQVSEFIPEGTFIKKGQVFDSFKDSNGNTVPIHLIANFAKTYDE